MPAFFYGTAWKEDRTAALTRLAVEQGFRAIDTANQRKHYHEAGVGEAVRALIADGSITREALFLQTKFTFRDGQDHRLPYDPRAPIADQVAQSFARSLEHLGTRYLDALVLHGPSRDVGLGPPDLEAWRAMETLHDAGTVRLLGVSNVTRDQLVALAKIARVRPAFVQNRCYARAGWDRDVRSYCAAEDITYQGFSLLTANGRELGDGRVVDLARRYRLTTPQLVFAFARALGMIPLTGTSSASHMRDDLASLDVALDDADARALERIAG